MSLAIGDRDGRTTDIGGSIDLDVVDADDGAVDGDEDAVAAVAAADLEASSLNSSFAKSSSSLV